MLDFADMMMQNVIMVAFDGVKALAAGVELMEAFQSLAKRPSILQAVEKRASAIWMQFKGSLDSQKVRSSLLRSSSLKSLL